MKDLIAKVLSGEASDIEQQQLQRWRRESPENETTFKEMEHVWRLSALQTNDEYVSPPPPIAEILAEAELRRSNAVPIQSRSKTHTRILRWAPVAAAAVLILSLGVLSLRRSPDGVFETGSNQTSTVALTDGSVVRLGPESRLVVWSSDQRSVSLLGTAFFAVASDSSSPFTIRTDAGTAEVLGTRFELRSSPDSLRLVVVEGRVALEAEGSRVEVGMGTMSRIVNGSTPTFPRAANVWDLLDWSDGLLIFQATPLDRVMEEVSTYFGVSVSLPDSALAARTVTAWFEDEALEDVVGTVCQVVGATCTVGESVEVSR